jgi:uncharacterized protein Yka (UPF0111/DUF47 family)
MKIENQNIFGGNQQFADLIINSKENNIDEVDRKFLQLVYDNTNSIEERKDLIKSLTTIKADDVSDNDKKISKSILTKFLDSIPGEVGKQVVKHLVENGSEYLSFLHQ